MEISLCKKISTYATFSLSLKELTQTTLFSPSLKVVPQLFYLESLSSYLKNFRHVGLST